MLLFAQGQLPNPIEITKQAEQFGAFVWFVSVVFMAMVVGLVLYAYFFALPRQKAELGLMESLGLTSKALGEAAKQNLVVSTEARDMAIVAASVSKAMRRAKLAEVNALEKVAKACNVDLDSELATIREALYQDGSQVMRAFSKD